MVQRGIKMPKATIYISGKELKRISKPIGGGEDGRLIAVRANGCIGFHDIIPTLKSITRYLERQKRIDEERLNS